MNVWRQVADRGRRRRRAKMQKAVANEVLTTAVQETGNPSVSMMIVTDAMIVKFTSKVKQPAADRQTAQER